ncbi:hypothetical protein DPMN_010402 [Dreissena polymorpha]|uniref:Uncharacterized protein n=1 Tax=Dreissena polymorpha TaxID=45954 RepID=A0A9D4RZ75_DREPO|nr:hypothetical protein DPMN_010402 [Dreissena polymorpha]
MKQQERKISSAWLQLTRGEMAPKMQKKTLFRNRERQKAHPMEGVKSLRFTKSWHTS